MSNIILLFACLVTGMAIGWSKRFPPDAYLSLNAFVLHISLPAVILLQIHHLHLRSDVLYSLAMPWMLFAAGCGLFWSLGRAMRFSAATTGGLMLVGGLANTSFVGLPMIEAFYGRSGMAAGILIDQLGTYLVLSTLGIMDYPAWLTEGLHSLGGTLAPLALVSVGLQLRLDRFRGNVSAPATGLTFKLLIGPVLVTLIYVWWLHARGQIIQITLFESTMGPMVGAAIVAIQHDLNPTPITLMVGVGITLSFITLPAWWYVLRVI